MLLKSSCTDIDIPKYKTMCCQSEEDFFKYVFRGCEAAEAGSPVSVAHIIIIILFIQESVCDSAESVKEESFCMTSNVCISQWRRGILKTYDGCQLYRHVESEPHIVNIHALCAISIVT